MRAPKTSSPDETATGFALVPPGTLYAVFKDEGGEYTDPVMAVFLKETQTDHGPVFSLDGFLHDDIHEPVSKLANFVRFSPHPLPEGGDHG